MNAVAISPMLEPLVEDMVRRIKAGEYKSGQRLPTLRRLADEYSMSVVMARKAMLHLRDRGLIRVHQRSGCYVNKVLPNEFSDSNDRPRLKVRPAVFLVITRDTPFATHLLMPTITALQKTRLDLSIANCAGPDRDKQLAHLFRSWQVASPKAIVIQGAANEVWQAIAEQYLPQTRIICTYGGVGSTHRGWDYVNPHESQMYQMACEYLLDRGHQSIGLTTIRRNTRNFKSAELRQVNRHILAMVDACERRQLSHAVKMHYFPTGQTIYTLSGRHPEHMQQLKAWLSGPKRPTGIVGRPFRLDTVKIAAEQVGLKIGRDLELIGVGDPTAALLGEYPCISENPELVAQEIVRLIDEPWSDDHVACDIRISPAFVPCQSHTTIESTSLAAS